MPLLNGTCGRVVGEVLFFFAWGWVMASSWKFPLRPRVCVAAWEFPVDSLLRAETQEAVIFVGFQPELECVVSKNPIYQINAN